MKLTLPTINRTRLLQALSMLAIIIAQYSHSVDLFVQTAHHSIGFNTIAGNCFSIGFDTSIIIFITKGEIRWAVLSSIDMLLINLLDYAINYITDAIAHKLIPDYSLLIVLIISAVVISSTLPGIIIAYSVLFHKDKKPSAPTLAPAYNTQITELKAQVAELKQQLTELMERKKPGPKPNKIAE